MESVTQSGTPLPSHLSPPPPPPPPPPLPLHPPPPLQSGTGLNGIEILTDDGEKHAFANQLPSMLQEEPMHRSIMSTDEVEKQARAISKHSPRVLLQQSTRCSIMSTASVAKSEVDVWQAEAEENEEKLRQIKARTMFEMVEELDDGAIQILFLTNSQANLISGDQSTLQNLFNALEIGKPSLLINLLMSYGFREGCSLWYPEDVAACNSSFLAGVVGGRAPFLSPDEEYVAETRIDIFMTEVVIPLAAKTNALILCDAVSQKCFLSRSFMRMCSVARARWGGKLPFTVLSIVSDVMALYRNRDETTYWRQLVQKSKAWKQRHAKIHEIALQGTRGNMDGHHDIDPNATCILVADSIDDHNNTPDLDALTRLRDALIRHLGGHVPTISFKTGMSWKEKLAYNGATTMQRPSDLGQNGQIVVFLDVRRRLEISDTGSDVKTNDPYPLLNSNGMFSAITPTKPIVHTAPPVTPNPSSREELIQFCKTHLSEWCDELLKQGLAETFDVCSLAFMHDCLVSDGLLHNEGGALPSLKPVALHEAIRLSQEGVPTSKAGRSSLVRLSTREEITEAAQWLTQRIFSDAWQVLQDREDREARGESYRSLWADQLLAQNSYMRLLLLSTNFHHANLYDMDGCRRLVNKLVQADRLPAENPLEGLRLLRSAWCDYDVAMLLASRYKRLCKMLFATQLILGFSVIVGSLMSDYLSKELDEENTGSALLQAAFFVSLAITFLFNIEGQLNPKARWKVLRSSAHSLRSIIWLYRTRTGPFESDETQRDSKHAEEQLLDVLNDWRENLVASAGLRETALKREYPESVYCHCQNGGVLQEGADDFQCPTTPLRYIELRVHPTINFYRKRIPVYTRQIFVFKCTISLFGVGATLLAHYKEPVLVAILTAASGTIMSWSEFSDWSSKVERYSKSITGLEKLLSWWDSLGEVQKASKEKIANLVGASEAIISEEMLSWTTAGSKDKEKDAKGSKDKESTDNGKEGGHKSNGDGIS